MKEPYCPDGHGCTVSVEKEKEMKMIDLLGDVLESEAMHDLLDHVVLGKLRSSLDNCAVERQRLDKIKANRELLPHEEEDWNCVVQDIHALNRVIDLYGG